MKRIILALLVLYAMIGCSNQDKGASPSPKSINGTDDGQMLMEQSESTDNKPVIKRPQKVTDHLEQLAKRVNGVKDANCVVIGNTAIVGIDVAGNLERARVGTIKYSVAEAFRKDKYGKYAIVTADLDFADRLREIRADIRNGKPLTGFANELADMIGRIMPQVPRDLVPQDTDHGKALGIPDPAKSHPAE